MTHKINASITVVINSIAQSKKAAGIRVFNLSAGEPKLTTPKIIRDAATKFIEKGDIPYPSPGGQLELRTAAINYFNQLYNSNFNSDECIITTGGKFGLYLMLQYLLGDNSPLKDTGGNNSVIIPAPYWVSYPAITKIMRGTSVIINTWEESGWKFTPQMLVNAYDPKCKILIINNGVNPTGAIYTRSEMQAIMDTAAKLDLLIISDEVYSSLVYNDMTYVSCASYPEHKDRTIIIQSASKSFAMTGWRVGFTLAPKHLIDAVTALASQSTTGVSLICQHAAITALENASEINQWVNASMKHRRNVLIEAFKEHLKIDLPLPDATLYSFVSMEKLGIKNISDENFCVKALENANVAIVPGSGFGKPGYIRLSFAAEEDDLIGGVINLAKFIKSNSYYN